MANNNEVKLSFKVFNQEFTQAMSEMDASSRRLRQELKLEQEQLKLTGTESEKLESNLKGLQQQHQVASDKVQATANQLARAKEYFGENSIEAKKLEDKLLALQIAEQRLANEVTQADQKLESQKTAARELGILFEATGTTVNDFADVLGRDLVNAINNGTANTRQLEQALQVIGRESLSSVGDLERLRSTLREVDDGGALNGLRQELERLEQQTEETGNSFGDLAEKAKDIGGQMTVGITAPIVGIGVAAGASAQQFDNAVGQIQAALGVTKEEAEALEQTARNVWKKGFGESLEEVSAGVIRVQQNMKEIDSSEIENSTRNALALAKSFESDVNEVTRAANNLMVNFGITSQEAFDLLAYGAQNGLNFSNELFDNVAEYSGLFKTLGFEADEYFQVLAKGSEKGVYNLDYLNDAVKEFGIRIKDGSATTSDAIATLFAPDDIENFIGALEKGGKATEEYQQLLTKVSSETADELVKNLQKGGKSFSDTSTILMGIMGESQEFFDGLENGSLRGSEAMQMVIEKIQALESPADRAAMGVALFGTKWEDLEETAMFSLTNINGELEGFDNNMQKVIDAQEQTFGQRWESFTRSAAAALEPLGNILLDLAEEWLPKIITVVETLAKGFANLSPGMQSATIATGGVVTAVGPLIAGFGFVANGIGSIISLGKPLIGLFAGSGAAAGAAAGSTGLLGGALSALTGPVGLAIAGVAALTAGGVALYKNWDTILEKKPHLLATFAAISPPVVLAVGAIKTMQEAMSPAIEKVNLFGEGVSGATQKALGGYLKLSDGVTQTLSEIYLTSTRVTGEMATAMVAKYDEMNTQIVEGMKVRHQEELTELGNYFMNSSALTSAEEEKILMNRQARNEREIEQQNFMNQRIKEITEQAAAEKRQLTEREYEIINNYNQMMKENAVQTFTESELEQKVIMERMKENASAVSAEQAAAVVKNAVAQKEKVIKEANETYEKNIAQIIKMRDETGDISAEQAEKMIAEAKKSRDQTVALAEERHEKIVSEAKTQAGEHVEQVNWETGEVLKKWQVFKNNAEETWKGMWSSVDKWFSEVGKSISTNIDKAVKWAGDGVDKITGFFKNLSIKIPKIELPKMPKFSLRTSTKSIFGKEITYPSGIDVNWNAKGAIFTKPTVFNSPNYGLQGFGEAGPEAALPLTDRVLGTIGSMIAQTMPQSTQPTLYIQPAPIILDGRVIAEATFEVTSSMQYNSTAIAAQMKGLNWG